MVGCPAELSSSMDQHACLEFSSVPSKTLISWFRCVWLGLELNSAGHRPSRTEPGDPCCTVCNKHVWYVIPCILNCALHVGLKEMSINLTKKCTANLWPGHYPFSTDLFFLHSLIFPLKQGKVRWSWWFPFFCRSQSFHACVCECVRVCYWRNKRY